MINILHSLFRRNTKRTNETQEEKVETDNRGNVEQGTNDIGEPLKTLIQLSKYETI